MRTAESGLPHFVAKHVSANIINAGDGWHEHPSQALLDIKTMLDHHKSIKNKVITIVGDISHSRVFGSLVRILKKYQANIQVVCPETFLPQEVQQFKINFISSIEEALPNTDVIYALRVQEERGAKSYIPSLREYSKTYGINPKRFAMAKQNAILMHPGPVIRDIDVFSALVNHERSKILDQIENGLAVRKAILWLINDRVDKKSKPFTLA
jgi:aspartate carbamoyltransferase catalytic subunit